MKRFRTISARVILLAMVMSVAMAMASICTAFAEVTTKPIKKTVTSGETTSEVETGAIEKTLETDDWEAEYGASLETITKNIDTGKGLTSAQVQKKTSGTYVKISDKYYLEGVITSAATNSNVNELDVNVKADVGSANDLVSGFEPVINLVIGIIAWVIVIGLPLITALDVMYITIPFCREKAEDARASGNKAMTKTGKDGSTKLRWISDEAQYAVSEIDIESGNTPLKKYLKSRIGAFIMVAIILYLLIGGQITVVTQLAVRLVSGIMSILSGLGN